MGAWNPTRPQTTRRSRSLRAQVLREEPLCRVEGCGQPATEDDHIVPWSQRQARGLTIAEWHARPNHQGLCAEHHRAKTQAEAQAARARAKRPTPPHPGLL